MKGMFVPGITAEMFRNGCLESIEALMAEGEIYDIEYSNWTPVNERLPKVGEKVLCQCQANIFEVLKLTVDGWYHDDNHCYMLGFVIAWKPLPQPYAESENKK